MSDAHQHALRYAELGLKTLPIRPGGKHPPMRSWQHAATNDTTTIDNWFLGLYSKCGVGIALGTQPNGQHLFALDIDRHGDIDGHDELHDLEHTHGAIPDTWRAITGSGGTHIILRAPQGVHVRNQQTHGNRLGTSIDIRGEGGQIVVAPTLHPDTLNPYTWEDGCAPWETPVAEAPQWIVDLVAEPPPTPPTPPPPAEPRRNDDLFQAHRRDWDWHTELTRRGWTETRTHGSDTYWTRPGKDPRDGHSAVLHGNDGPLVIFTTEIDQAWMRAGTRTTDGSGWSFGPFGFYAATEHAGDRSQAARSLAERYGATIDQDWRYEPADERTEPPQVDYDAELLAMLLDWPTFFTTDHTAEEWLWEPIIPARRGLVIWAKGGSGKSLVMLRLAVDLAEQGTRIL
ncbi:MAG: bifunctional DNA primase/polymerase, partial [Ilumatobacteraceae bacterium]